MLHSNGFVDSCYVPRNELFISLLFVRLFPLILIRLFSLNQFLLVILLRIHITVVSVCRSLWLSLWIDKIKYTDHISYRALCVRPLVSSSIRYDKERYNLRWWNRWAYSTKTPVNKTIVSEWTVSYLRTYFTQSVSGYTPRQTFFIMCHLISLI